MLLKHLIKICSEGKAWSSWAEDDGGWEVTPAGPEGEVLNGWPDGGSGVWRLVFHLYLVESTFHIQRIFRVHLQVLGHKISRLPSPFYDFMQEADTEKGINLDGKSKTLGVPSRGLQGFRV